MARLALLIAAVGLLGSASACGRTPFDPRALEPLEELLPEDDPVSEGCRKVDYLFVIDNSASMADNQQKLIDSFDGFISAVQQTQEGLDSVHVGVVTTDVYAANSEPCAALGGLVTQTAGYNSSEAQCGPYAEGYNFMTEADDLATAFPCAAQVGTTGSTSEAPLEALTSAATKMHGEGECNEGFMRDDALLVVVIVTDEDDPGFASSRYEKLVDAKGGRSDNVVVVALVNEPGTDCRLSGHATESTEITAFAQMFLHSFIAPVCGDYSEAFAGATAVVQAACWDDGS